MSDCDDLPSAGIRVTVQDAILSGNDFTVELSLDDPLRPASAKVTVCVGRERRDFGMKRGARVLPRASEQHITIAGSAIWSITAWGAAPEGARVVVRVEEKALPGPLGHPARLGSGQGTVVG